MKFWIREVREDNKLGGYQTISTFVAVAVVSWTASSITWSEITRYTLPFAWFTWTWTVISVVAWLFHPYYTIVCDERNRITISSRTLNCGVATFLMCFWEVWIVIASVAFQSATYNENGNNQNIFIMDFDKFLNKYSPLLASSCFLLPSRLAIWWAGSSPAVKKFYL